MYLPSFVERRLGMLNNVLKESTYNKEREDLVFSRYDHHWNTQAHKLVVNQCQSVFALLDGGYVYLTGSICG